MFGLIVHTKEHVQYRENHDGWPCVLEGAGLIQQLTPIDPRTRQPSSITDAIRRAVNDPSLSSLVSQVVQDLPTIRSDSRLTDDDKLDMVISRFAVGTPAENAIVAERLSQISSVLFPSGDEPASTSSVASDPGSSSDSGISGSGE